MIKGVYKIGFKTRQYKVMLMVTISYANKHILVHITLGSCASILKILNLISRICLNYDDDLLKYFFFFLED